MQKLQFFAGQKRSRRLAAQIGLTAACVLLCAGSSQGEVVVTTLGGGAAAIRDGLTTQARFNDPYGLALDTSGNLYMADRNNNRIRKVTAAGDKATSRTTSFIISLNKPVDVAIDASGNLLVLTAGDGRIRKYGTAGTTGNLISTNYPVLSAPSAFALDAAGNIYVTQTNGFLKRIPVTNSAIAQIITNGFRQPQGVAVLASGNIAVSDTGNNAIRQVNPSTFAITHLSGSTNGASGFADGAPTVARFYQPHKLAKAPNGNLVVADRYNHRVRLVLPSGTASTLYGVSSNLWNASYYPGWFDGTSTNAHAREPVGVTVATNGNVFTTEVRWDLLRVATGGDTGAGTGGGTIGGGGSTATNSINFGFANGEASSDFIGAAGQSFYAPVTLSLVPAQKIYAFQFNVTVTNLGPVNITDLPAFFSMLQKPSTDTNLPPGYFDAIEPSILTSFPRLMTVGWFERYSGTNLYNTLAQDLVTYSQAHNFQYNSVNGKVFLGAYRFTIPSTAQPTDIYQIELGRPSGTQDGVQTPVNIRPVNALKQVSIANRRYIVGDTIPFRWFNAGDFGDGFIVNTDLIQVFQSCGEFKPIRINTPPSDSDFFDAMDSSDGTVSTSLLLADDSSIDTITQGDGSLNVDDLYVSYRRSLDPTLKWFARYWTNGFRAAEEVPNVFPQSFTETAAPKYVQDVNSGAAPFVTFVAPDVIAGTNRTIVVPIRAEIKGTLPIRITMLNFSIKPLDGSPAVASIQFTSPLGQPAFADSQGVGSYGAAWLNRGAAGLYGTNNIGTLTINLPVGTPNNAAYSIQFNHASASPNGLGVFPQKTCNGLLTVTDRSASSQNDGIPDSWRLKYFGTISSNLLSLASSDADGDGVSNFNEYKAGTDPNNITSFLRLLDAKKQAGLTVRWPSVSGKTYVVESSPALLGTPWSVISTNITGTGDNLEYTDSSANPDTRFYRVRVLEP